MKPDFSVSLAVLSAAFEALEGRARGPQNALTVEKAREAQLVASSGELTNHGALLIAMVAEPVRVAQMAARLALEVGSADDQITLRALMQDNSGGLIHEAVNCLTGSFDSGARRRPAVGCAAMAGLAAARCEQEEYATRRQFFAYEALLLGEAAWRASGVWSGFEHAVLECLACGCDQRAQQAHSAGCHFRWKGRATS